jgi:hypothetical protein
MNPKRFYIIAFVLALGMLSAVSVDAERVFPGAQGFGADSPAGRGGRIIRVTNLNGDGPGSLRAALEVTGPRIVVFEVGGVINLNREGIRIRQPFLTVAGQTAPSPGITLIRGGISVETHDILIQHIRVRPGDADQPKRSGWQPDGIGTSGGDAFNITIDHCSLSWAVDENLSASGPRTEGPGATSHKVTFSNCIIAEALDDSSHEKGPHSKGSLIHDYCRDIAIVGNLYAHNSQRNPYFKAFTTGAIVNNVIYNPGRTAIQLGYSSSEWKDVPVSPENCRVSVVGNIFIHGVDTRAGLPMVGRSGDAYLEDNAAIDRDGAPGLIAASDVRVLNEKPVWPANLIALPSSKVIESVVANAGARPRDRDPTDERIIRDFLARKGRIIDSQRDVGGYPNPERTERSLQIPDDVDTWLARLARELEAVEQP